MHDTVPDGVDVKAGRVLERPDGPSVAVRADEAELEACRAGVDD
jgi:hypothetical protein